VLETSSSIGAVFSDAIVVDSALRPLDYRLWETISFGSRDQKLVSEAKGFDVLLNRNVVTGATLTFRSALRRLVLPISPHWVHDGWIALIVAAHQEIAAVAEPLIYYRQHDQQQIGARRVGIRTKIALILGDPRYASAWRHFLRPTAEQFTAIEARLTSALTEGNFTDTTRMARLKEKILHLRARETLQTRLWMRSSVVLREIVRGRYHSYSGGWESAICDLLRGAEGPWLSNRIP
jgi:hypothetical protein